ncbi:histidine phosphatase family protein [Paenibacillus sp. VCA1]|uniref:histidine phosphatase family protein n=1 Tax=Paenibacillus sp. VCA1 TaxID=3039148 RepID=UPI00287144BA|nr:histidine phosphatase family protein [Paenibacillus sp. VCA1]MDR9853920.1 histidine phosphatase family protein [Paenibacillus sp. VCA1]
MTTFFLVRHALKEKAVGDVPLTSRGVMQAQATGKRFSGLPIDAVYSSPLRRARETAEHIALATKSPVYADRRLRERANWGDLPGQSFDEFVAMWERCTREPEYMPPVGDSAKQAGERLSSLLAELAAQYPAPGSVVLVTHGGLITDFLVHAFPENELEAWHPNFIAVQSELIPECSITTLQDEGGTYRIVDFASVGHLKSIS